MAAHSRVTAHRDPTTDNGHPHETLQETSSDHHKNRRPVEHSDVIYAKAWAGPLVYQDPDAEVERRQRLTHWRVTPELMERSNEAAFMHCLPVRRGVVVDDAVLDGPQAIHLLQAEFRLHAQKAILEYVWDLHEGERRNGREKSLTVDGR